MNENHKNEIEELLSDLVDEQAGDRQKTEFKRLVAHDSGLIDQLAAMQRQRDILNALPVESAPDSLADDITAMLERKLILGDTPPQKKDGRRNQPLVPAPCSDDCRDAAAAVGIAVFCCF